MGFYFFVGGLLLSGAAFGAGAGRSVFVSEAPQGVVNQYYERIPLGGKDIVFNSKPIGRETRRIFEPTGSQLWVGHLAKSDVKPLRGKSAGTVHLLWFLSKRAGIPTQETFRFCG